MSRGYRVEASSRSNVNIEAGHAWPELPWKAWADTAATLHMWLQIIGKIRMALASKQNHWWHVTLYPSCTGLTTSPMPYGNRHLQIDFDFIRHRLVFQPNDGLGYAFELGPMSVSDFYRTVMETLHRLGMPITMHTLPSEVPEPIPFEEDHRHAAYDPVYANRYWQILLQSSRVMDQFRSRFIGKCSPTHLFWGGMDLASTRFSGRSAPEHLPVPFTPLQVVRTAYSHEVSSCGFWPGGPMLPEPVFYAYAYPAPPGYAQAAVSPSEAHFKEELGEFILPYEAVRTAANPEQHLLKFLQSTYEAAADLGKWNRRELEANEEDL